MTIAKKLTKDDLLKYANDPAGLDKVLDKYFKQDSYRTDKAGKPKMTTRKVTIKHFCSLCKSKWVVKRKIPTNVEMDPDVALTQITCIYCPEKLIRKGKEELALMLITMARKGHNITTDPKKADSTNSGMRVDREAIKFAK